MFVFAARNLEISCKLVLGEKNTIVTITITIIIIVIKFIIRRMTDMMGYDKI
jgi:hypothetical protein